MASVPTGRAAERTVVINAALADGLWPGEEPVGRCIRFERPDAPCFTIIGVVETARRNEILETPKPQYYLPFGVAPFADWAPSSIIVRTEPRARADAERAIGREVRLAMPSARPVVTTMTDMLAPLYRPWKLGAELFALFGGLALVVAIVGIYGTVAYGVSQRVHEFGVRIALGARARDVAGQIVGEGVRVVGVGVAVGSVLSLVGGRLVAALLYGVAPWDPRVMLGVAVVLVSVAVLASAIPAWRASRVDPVDALRAD